jgi:hypothetical protein
MRQKAEYQLQSGGLRYRKPRLHVGKYLSDSTYRVRLVSGATTRRKVAEIDDITAADAAAAFPC